MDFDRRINEVLAHSKGIKKIIHKIVFKILRPTLDIAVEEVEQEVTQEVARESARLNAILDEHAKRLTVLETNIRNNNDRIDRIVESCAKTERDLAEQNLALKVLEERFDKLYEYAANVGERLDHVRAAMAQGQGSSLEKKEKALPVLPPDDNGDTYTSIDYFDFENQFRGDTAHIREVQEQYLPYFAGCKNVLDIGCGRGEFLELLKSHGIHARGIDMYQKAVDYCKIKGLDVICGDALSYLAGFEDRLDGIFAGQVVEHLTMEQIIRLCNTAYEKLEEGGYLIMETPNPTSLAIYTHAFYIDPSHVKPVHPLTLQYCSKKAGFSEAEILYTKNSRLPVEIPKLTGAGIENSEEFNNAMQVVSDMLFGSQDYAIIAKK